MSKGKVSLNNSPPQKAPARQGQQSRIKNIVFALLCAGFFFLYFNNQVLDTWQRMHSNDFKHLYLGSYLILKGGNPYDDELVFTAMRQLGFERLNPFVYLPFTGLVLAPIAMLSFDTAQLVWFILNHAFIIISVILCFRVLKIRPSWPDLAFVLLILAYNFPFYRTLTAGQLNVVLLLLFCLIWATYLKKWDTITGFLISFAALFKLSPALLFLYFLLKKDFKIVAWGIFWLCLLLGFSVIVIGLQVHLDFLTVLGAMSYGHSTWAQYGKDFYREPFNQSFNSLFHHLFTANPYTYPILNFGPTFANLITYIVAIGLLITFSLIIFRRPRETSLENTASIDTLDYCLFIFLSLLLPSLLWDHYLTVLIFPLIITYKMLKNTKDWKAILLFVLGIALILPPLNFAAPAFQQGAGILLMSIKLWGTLVLLAVVLLIRGKKGIKKYRDLSK